jgi:hypothetical protein
MRDKRKIFTSILKRKREQVLCNNVTVAHPAVRLPSDRRPFANFVPIFSRYTRKKWGSTASKRLQKPFLTMTAASLLNSWFHQCIATMFSFDYHSQLCSIWVLCLERSISIHPRFPLANLIGIASVLTVKYHGIVITVIFGLMKKVVSGSVWIAGLDHNMRQCIRITPLWSLNMHVH